MKILIAEDEPSFRLYLKKILTNLNHEVITSVNGKEAWEKLIENDVRMVIADWMMPEMDGITFCHRIRSAQAQNQLKGYVYFVLLTSMESKENVVQGLEAGADDYLIKNNLSIIINTRSK